MITTVDIIAKNKNFVQDISNIIGSYTTYNNHIYVWIGKDNIIELDQYLENDKKNIKVIYLGAYLYRQHHLM